MRKSLLIATGAAILGAALSFQASAKLSPEEYCQDMAFLATSFARDRDSGMSEDSAEQEVYEAMADYQADKGEYDAGAVNDILFVVERVYDYPHMTPKDEGNAIYGTCRDTYITQ